MISISTVPFFWHVHFRTIGCNQLVSCLVVSKYPRMGLICPNVKLLCVIKLAVLDTVALIVKPVDGEWTSSAADERYQRLRITM